MRHLALSAVLLSAVVSGVFGQEQAKPMPKAEVEKIVKEYLMAHPEVIIDSVRAYQERERAAQIQKSKNGIIAKSADLTADPTSPATTAPKPGTGQITIVEFFDYRCGYCKKVHPTVAKVLADNPSVRLVYKEFPILGPDSLLAAKAALAADKQGKYLKFHDTLMSAKEPVTDANLDSLSKEAGLDVAKMRADMKAPDIEAVINKNMELASAIDISATPSFVIGSELVQGAIDAAEFKRLIEKAKSAGGASAPAAKQ